jgi:hypothetical protein
MNRIRVYYDEFLNKLITYDRYLGFKQQIATDGSFIWFPYKNDKRLVFIGYL